MALKLVALAGGVGGAKLVDGLAQEHPSGSLTVVVNTGDDFVHLGLHISPDLDTVLYTLAGLANAETGWGREEESWNAMAELERLGGPTWFQLGDKDLAMHLARTQALREGRTLSEFTRRVRAALGVSVQVLPMSDEPVTTIVHTAEEGDLPFQTYFVKRGCEPVARGFTFAGADQAEPAPGVQSALEAAECVVLCPSNPWVSLDPILAVPGLRAMVSSKPTVAVSPIIGGRALKGPAAKIYREMGVDPSAAAVARHYDDLLRGIVIDEQDRKERSDIEAMGIECLVTDSVMRDRADRARLASEVISFAQRVAKVGVSA